MRLSGTQVVFVAVQLGVAGLTFGLGVDQALAWWRERTSSLRWMTLTSFALVAVLAANVAVVEAAAGWPADLALLGRAVALSVTAVLVVVVASSIGNVRPPHWVAALVVSLAKALGLQVIAEGIETEEQRLTLIELGCTLGQGVPDLAPGAS